LDELVVQVVELREKRDLLLALQNNRTALEQTPHLRELCSQTAWLCLESIITDIRRCVRGRKDSVTLSGLMESIRDKADLLTREWFLGRFKRELMHIGASTFERFGPNGAASISSTIVQKDVDELREVTKSLCTIADRAIAHIDKRAWEKKDQYACSAPYVAQCVEYISSVLGRYYLLVRGSDLSPDAANLPDWDFILRQLAAKCHR